MKDYLKKAKQFYATRIARYLGDPRGCSDLEINDLERDLGFDLPAAYVEYLQWMGNDKGGMFVGTDCFIDHVKANTQDLPKLLAENKIAFRLPPSFLAWFSHQGYHMVWFALPAESDDPESWRFCEGEMPSPQPVGEFSEWLSLCVEELAEVIADLNEKKGW